MLQKRLSEHFENPKINPNNLRNDSRLGKRGKKEVENTQNNGGVV
jgi:hypothetical protein